MLYTSRRPDFTSRRLVRGGRFNTNWRQTQLTAIRNRGAAAIARPAFIAATQPASSNYLINLEASGSGTVPLEPGIDVPGNPVDPGSLIGPPLRSGYIQGQSPPVLPGAPSAYPIVVPEPARLKPVLVKSLSSATQTIAAGVPFIMSLNDSIPRISVSSNGQRTSDNTRALGFRVRGYVESPFGNQPAMFQRYRLLLVYDKQPEAAVPPPSDMFDPDYNGNITAVSATKFGTRDRYRVLWSREGEVILPSKWSGLPGVYDPVLINERLQYFTATINCNLPVNYGRGPPLGPGSISLGNIYLVALGPPDIPYTTIDFRCDIDYLYRDH